MRDLFGTRRIRREVRRVSEERVEGEIVVAANGNVIIGAPTAEAVIILPTEGDE